MIHWENENKNEKKFLKLKNYTIVNHWFYCIFGKEFSHLAKHNKFLRNILSQIPCFLKKVKKRTKNEI
jgi:hypothetical protein